MNSRTDGSAPPPSGPDPARTARRIAERRGRLGLTEDSTRDDGGAITGAGPAGRPFRRLPAVS
ncbi:hypothetical protein [Kitasatospora indigofera]|uniref:hypothetical protein n=1 Tax=Kitasatospora indigofera TaxID=67307 RepID=UPI00339EEB9F